MVPYERFLNRPLSARTSRGKARLVLGARQTGKSTLFRMIQQPGDMLTDLQERSERVGRAAGGFRRVAKTTVGIFDRWGKSQ